MSILKKLRIPALLGVGLTLATLAPSVASSHREAPLIAQDPVADNTDVFAFVSPDRPNTVTLLADFIPFEQPEGGPNYYNFGDDVLYQIHVDNNGDAQPDITYEWRFRTEIQNPNTFLYNTGPINDINDPNFNYRQFYDLTVIRGGIRSTIGSHLAVPPVNVGPKSTPNYEALARQGVYTLGNVTTFAGQRDDPFFIDVGAAFDLFTLRPLNNAHKITGPVSNGVDQLAGLNVHTLGVQVPISDLTAGDPVIGVYSQAKRQQTRVLQPSGPGSATLNQGNWVNVSRLANPLVNELVIPLSSKDKFNASEPRDDAQFLPFVQDPEPARLIKALYGLDVPPAPRNDFVTIFLTGLPGLNQPRNVKPSEMMRLNTGIAPTSGSVNGGNPLGVLAGDNAGFPNGRRLVDDVTDIELRASAGATPLTPGFIKSPNNVLGDGVNVNDGARTNSNGRPFLESFPYVATPHQGVNHTHHRDGDGLQPAAPLPVTVTTPTTAPGATTTTAPPATTTTTAPARCDYPASYKQYLTPEQLAQLTAAGRTFCG